MVENSQQDRYRLNRCQTVGEAAHSGFTVLIRCKRCGHRRVVDAAPLWRLVRVRMWPDNFIALGSHVRCGRCRAKYPEVRASSEPADDQPVVGIKSYAEAIRAAQRLRN